MRRFRFLLDELFALRALYRQMNLHEFDENKYVARYSGVAAAIKAGQFKSALQHYILHGWAEGRSPASVERISVARPPEHDMSIASRITSPAFVDRLNVLLEEQPQYPRLGPNPGVGQIH